MEHQLAYVPDQPSIRPRVSLSKYRKECGDYHCFTTDDLSWGLGTYDHVVLRLPFRKSMIVTPITDRFQIDLRDSVTPILRQEKRIEFRIVLPDYTQLLQ